MPGPRVENMASRTRSNMGRVPRPGGALRMRPRNSPEMMRMGLRLLDPGG